MEKRPSHSLWGRLFVDNRPSMEDIFTDRAWIYPATIVQARYGGSYEGSEWLAFPCYPDLLREKCPSWDDSDVECAEFWDTAKNRPDYWLIGHGSTPDKAMDDLIARVQRWQTAQGSE